MSKSTGERLLLAAEKGRLLELIQLLHEDGTSINHTDSDGYSPLHRASYNGCIDCAKYLVRHGANIEAKTNDDWTPLHCAVRWNNIDIAEFLIKSGADINAKSDGGNTPLHIVSSNGRYNETSIGIQMLLYNPNCDYTLKNQSGDRAFDLARRSGPLYRFWVGVTTIFPEGMKEES